MIKNILIIKLSSIGDCLLATPAIESIRKAYPDSFITWLIEDKSKDIALLNPHVNEVITIDKKKFKLKDYLDLIIRLRLKKYDMSIDLQGVDRTSLYAFLSGAGLRYTEEYAGLGFLSNKKMARKGRPLEHAVKFYLFLANACGGIQQDKIKLILVTDKKDKEFAENFLLTRVMQDNASQLLIGINPGGTWITKRWPVDYFINLSKMLIDRLNAKIVFFGGADDKHLFKKIFDGIPDKNNIISAIGETTLKEAKELIAKMDFFLTSDSGLMHVAASIDNGPEIIALFGPTSPELTGPVGKNTVILNSGLICSPCFKKNCPLITQQNKDKKRVIINCALCMKKIMPEDVFNSILSKVKIAKTNN